MTASAVAALLVACGSDDKDGSPAPESTGGVAGSEGGEGEAGSPDEPDGSDDNEGGEDGGNENGGEATGGTPSGGAATGGAATGGAATGGAATGGVQTGGMSTGGSVTGGVGGSTGGTTGGIGGSTGGATGGLLVAGASGMAGAAGGIAGGAGGAAGNVEGGAAHAGAGGEAGSGTGLLENPKLESAECLDCLAANSCDSVIAQRDPYCGPGTDLEAECRAYVECIEATHCADYASVIACYCGTIDGSVVEDTCFNSTPDAPTGACRAEVEALTGETIPVEVGYQMLSPTHALGAINFYYEYCRDYYCYEACGIGEWVDCPHPELPNCGL